MKNEYNSKSKSTNEQIFQTSSTEPFKTSAARDVSRIRQLPRDVNKDGQQTTTTTIRSDDSGKSDRVNVLLTSDSVDRNK